ARIILVSLFAFGAARATITLLPSLPAVGALAVCAAAIAAVLGLLGLHPAIRVDARDLREVAVLVKRRRPA
ncbi:MAG TPA: lipopolysaccharide biosynthesis protein, partial [Brachybacterium faecium]|nr:lipopolysaccharide biosynthesis protein [Brachybacterium faecium]